MSGDLSRLPNTLTSKQLLIGLVLLTLIPFAFVVTLYWSLPVTPDPVLEVEVQIAPRTWQSNDGTQARLLPSAIVRNTTSAKWNNVNFAINDQFFYYHPDPIDPAGELVVPLKFFHTKGNQFFPPENQSIKTFTIYAQIPSGARAIRELHATELLGADDVPTSN